jgi:hypothetical protein
LAVGLPMRIEFAQPALGVTKKKTEIINDTWIMTHLLPQFNKA